MDVSVVFLGTGGSVPTARRATACLLARIGGERILFDCGEGSQRQMQRSTGLVQVDEIYVTHFHADHYLGVPGLLKTYDLQGRERPLRIIGPAGLIDLFKSIGRIIGRISYQVDLVELDSGEAVRHDGYEVRSFPVEHRMRAHGYALIEDQRPGRFDPEAAALLGVAAGPDFGRLQEGEPVPGSDGLVRPEQVMGEPRRGRKLVISGDTAPCEATRVAAHEAELLVHDGSFADEEADRALETGHSTARQAAELAHEAGVKLLTLVHVSSRYDVREVLAEAREAFAATEAPRDFDVVELPLPERAPPRLIENGARAPAAA
jgi:ribonuclease Z